MEIVFMHSFMITMKALSLPLFWDREWSQNKKLCHSNSKGRKWTNWRTEA